MTGQQLRNSILQEAIHGRLVPNVLQPGEKTGAELLQDILAERQKKENEEKGKKARKLSLSIIEDEPWELPEGWCWCKLEDIGSWGAGATPQRGNAAFYQNGTIPWLKTGELNNTIIYDTEEKVTELALEKCSLRLCQPNDVLIAMYGATIGKLAIAGVPITTNQACCACTPYSGIYNKYLFYFLQSKKDDFTKQAFGGAQPNISKEKIINTDFPLPTLSIQKAIVAKIEELLPLVDEYDKAAVELKVLNETLPDKLRKSVLQEAIHGNLVSNDIPAGEATASELLQQILKERQDKENKEKGKKAKKLTLSTIDEEPWELPGGWCWCKLGDVFEMQAGKNINTGEIHEMQSNEFPYPCYGGNGIRGYVKTHNTIGTHTIIGRQGALCGNVKYAEGPFYATEHAVVVNMTVCDVMWSYHFLIACDLNQYATKTAQPGLSVVKILDTYIPFPPLTIQHRIVEKIEELFSAINTL